MKSKIIKLSASPLPAREAAPPDIHQAKRGRQPISKKRQKRMYVALLANPNSHQVADKLGENQSTVSRYAKEWGVRLPETGGQQVFPT